MAFLPLDGPALQAQQTVTTTTPFRVKVGTSELEGRNVVTIQSLTGNIWIYFAEEGVTPTEANVRDRGFLQTKNTIASYEAGPLQQIYVLADTISCDVRFAERG
jgi:hypothetical protein